MLLWNHGGQEYVRPEPGHGWFGTHSGWWSLWTLCAAQPCLRDIGTHTQLGLFPDLKSVDLVDLLGGPGEPESQ